uniref:Uncharacterized protein n=1 Tax=Anopheles atroparvus TaxID=41427 RepID=A0AAG5D432_ANOAO
MDGNLPSVGCWSNTRRMLFIVKRCKRVLRMLRYCARVVLVHGASSVCVCSQCRINFNHSNFFQRFTVISDTWCE